MIALLIVVLCAGFLLWVVKTAPFLDDQMKGIARWLIIVVVACFVLKWLFTFLSSTFPNLG